MQINLGIYLFGGLFVLSGSKCLITQGMKLKNKNNFNKTLNVKIVS